MAAPVAELVARAEEALVRRDLSRARAEAEQAVGIYPEDPSVHLLLGRVELAAARPGDAVEELRRALRLDPLYLAAHRILGYALVASGRFGEAVQQWEQWERLASNSDSEAAQLDDVRRAKAAAQTLAGVGAVRG
jgi:cytochrome c-type biogenesis protein CcmH/NrfG